MDVIERCLARGEHYAVGYFGYEFFQALEPDFRVSQTKEGIGLPDAYFHFFREGEAGVIHWAGVASNPGELISAAREVIPEPNMTFEGYVNMVERARRYIAQGDIYQVNLSQRFKVPLRVHPLQLFKLLYEAQPVPFACYLDFGGFQLLSGSMELFLRRRGRRIVTRPIKGTRRRGRSAEEDEALRDELASSEKERAENLMIVDLMRNDLGRVCECGSVRVNELFKIEPYATLYQMVSEVEGELREGITLKDILRSTFPPGSVTGAPKRRAMEIIDELEPHLREPYCGAIGVFTPGGDFTLSVAIRVLVATLGEGTFWVGGGIVWDSEPRLEYEETLVKARALMKALGIG